MKSFFLRFYNWLKAVDIFDKKVFSALYIGIGACFAVIVMAQFGLRNTSTRRFFTKIDSYEGAYFEVSADAEHSEPQSILLSASGDDFSGALIYLNGEVYSELKNGENEIKITDWSVVEIYAPKGKVEAFLKSKSDEVTVYALNDKITTERKIEVFGRFGLTEIS